MLGPTRFVVRHRKSYNKKDKPIFLVCQGAFPLPFPDTGTPLTILEYGEGSTGSVRRDANLRRICGFRRVADAATFSRRLKECAGSGVLDRVLNGLVRQYQGEGLVDI